MDSTPRPGLILVLGALLALAACSAQASAPAPVPSTPSLPPPLIRVSLPTPTMLPETLTAPTGNLLPGLRGLVEQKYGDRLIRRILIPAIDVTSPVYPVGWQVDSGDFFSQPASSWELPEGGVGWAAGSGLPGDPGNILLFGHNNLYDAVFRKLAELQPGERIFLENSGKIMAYEISQVETLPLLGANEDDLARYNSFLSSSDVPKLTLVSCWPYLTNTHRVIVVAFPALEALP
jgi:LPXTG-site transpeptidase (sortase) family protein